MSATTYTLGKAESKLNRGEYVTATELMDQFFLWQIGMYFGPKTVEIIDQQLAELDLEHAPETNQYGWLKTENEGVVIYRRDNRQIRDSGLIH